MNTKEYLGDGVYVQGTLAGVKLTTENGIETTNIIYLEPRVIYALVDWLSKQRAIALKTALGEALKPEL